MKKTPLLRKESMRDSYARRQRDKMQAKMAAGEHSARPSCSFKPGKASRQRKPRKPLNKVSEKQKAENALYEKAKREWRAGHDGRCEMMFVGNTRFNRGLEWPLIAHQCKNQAMNQPHHLKKRLGGNLYDKSTFIGLCFQCHSWVHDNENHARAIGWLEA